jgi:imidazolonepropionase-like amidohydrolase
VAKGKRADLVLLDANPRADIANSQRISGVALHGRWLDRPAIETRLKALLANP